MIQNQINNITEVFNNKTYEKVLSTNKGEILFYPQSKLIVKKHKIVNKPVTYISNIDSERNHQIKLNQKQINFALSQSKFDDKLIDLRLFEKNCNNLLDVIELMNTQNNSNTVIEYRKRENVIVN